MFILLIVKKQKIKFFLIKKFLIANVKNLFFIL